MFALNGGEHGFFTTLCFVLYLQVWTVFFSLIEGREEQMEQQWVNEIIKALKKLGGVGKLHEIYEQVKKNSEIDLSSYTDWKSQVRKHIYLHSSDCDIFKGEDDLFYAVKGKGKGYWGLRDFKSSGEIQDKIAQHEQINRKHF